MNMIRRTRRHCRKGTILVLSALLMVAMMAMIAFAVDMGYLYNTRTELQRSADSAAIAACWELVDPNGAPSGGATLAMIENAHLKAGEYAAYNRVISEAPSVAAGDVSVGYIANPRDPNSPFLTTGYVGSPNAVVVQVRRDATSNGKVALFFAPVLGVSDASVTGQATAALVNGFNGFKSPGDGSNLELLPFALDETTWNGLMAGSGSDSYCFNSGSGTPGSCGPGGTSSGSSGSSVSAGGDGIKEVNLYPQGTGSPGNRGTVDIGSSNNSTNDIARQILNGVSAADLAHHGGTLEFDATGKLYLNGDTGISAGVKDELEAIKGQPRVIPIFRSVTGPGNNANYTIVKFVGIRIMNVRLTGSMNSKQVIIQPANVVAKGGIPGGSTTSQFISSPVWLVR